MVEMEIYGVSFDLVGKMPIVLLKTADGSRYLPIWIGPAEADAIAVRLQEVAVARPLTHDLLRSIIDSLGASVEYVIVNDLSAAAWGELCTGAGMGASDVLTVFVGSGVGSAIITNGRLIQGARGVAGQGVCGQERQRSGRVAAHAGRRGGRRGGRGVHRQRQRARIGLAFHERRRVQIDDIEPVRRLTWVSFCGRPRPDARASRPPFAVPRLAARALPRASRPPRGPLPSTHPTASSARCSST